MLGLPIHLLFMSHQRACLKMSELCWGEHVTVSISTETDIVNIAR